MGYSRDFLLAFKDDQAALPQLPQSLVSDLRKLDINAIPKTVRGTRAGTAKQRISNFHIAQPTHGSENLIPTIVSLNRQTPRIQSHCNPSNLTQVLPKSQKGYVNISVLNARSVCNKTTAICDYVIEGDIDLLCLTETWLTTPK